MQLDSQPWVKGEHYDRQSNWICPNLWYFGQDLANAVYWHVSCWRCEEVVVSKAVSDPFGLNVTTMSKNAGATVIVL